MRRELRITAASAVVAILIMFVAAALVATIGLGGVAGLCVIASAVVAAFVTAKYILKRSIK